MWVVLAYNRLMYFAQKPRSIGYFLDFSARGYVDLVSSISECRVVEKKQESGLLSGFVGRYCFRVKENNTSIVFSASNEAERNEWVAMIQEAIKGVVHTSPALGPSSDTNSYKRSNRIGYEAIVYPLLSGPLKKKSSAGTNKLGFGKIKTRLRLLFSS